jgi:serine/threonine-protein kinase
MQLESAQDLIEALRSSGLFTPEQFTGLLRELAPLAGNAVAMVEHLVESGYLTNYQLGKVLRGRASDLLVGPYVITDKLGSGGMGKVYSARCVDDGRTVALKVVRPALVQNPTVRGRYAREVQAAGALSHENIVGILGAGEANGRVYMAMEFVNGIDLARLMRDFEMVKVEEACEYIRQAALGLQHAHERGFVHRDVKPSNLVVAGERHLPQSTEPAVVKLLDLGLARAIDPDDMVAPDLTRDHAVVGTPDYMAPEQAKSSRHVDPRADLYSLGCTLYFLLTGRVPFPYPSAIEKILAHLNELPTPLQGLRPEVSAALAGIVARLMAKRPEDRFPSAEALAEALVPHTRYPADAPPHPVIRKRDTSHDTPSDQSQSPVAPSTSTSVPPLSALTLALADASPAAAESRVQPVAPSDNTPRPRGRDPVPESAPTTPPAYPIESIRPVVAAEPLVVAEEVEAAEEVVEAPKTVDEGEALEFAVPRARPRRKLQPQPPARGLPLLVWGVLLLLVLTNLALLLWLVAKS